MKYNNYIKKKITGDARQRTKTNSTEVTGPASGNSDYFKIVSFFQSIAAWIVLNIVLWYGKKGRKESYGIKGRKKELLPRPFVPQGTNRN